MAGLVRDTKTILLHGGMQDSVNEYLVEAPNMVLVQNGVFTKDGVTSKRKGYDLLSPTTTPSGVVQALFAANDTYYTVGSSGFYTYTGDDWKQVSEGSPILAAEPVVRIPEKPGAQCFSQSCDDDFLYVAYETHNDAPTEIGGTSVVLECYTLEGDLLSTKTVRERQAPRVVSGGGVTYFLYYDTAVQIYRVSPGTTTLVFLTTIAATATTIFAHADFAPTADASSNVYQHTLRGGFPQYSAVADVAGYVYVQTGDSATGQITISRIHPFGALTGTNATTGTDDKRLLGLLNLLGTVYSLYAHLLPAGLGYSTKVELHLRKVLTASMGTSWDTTLLAFADNTSDDVLCGSTCAFSAGGTVTGVTMHTPGYGSPGLQYTKFFQVSSTGTVEEESKLYGYRLSSELLLADSKVFACLEQGTPLFGGADALFDTGSDTEDQQASLLVKRKPKASVLSVVNVEDATFAPVAVFASNNGECVPADDCALIHQLPPMLEVSDTIRTISRELYSSADSYINPDDGGGNVRGRKRLRFGSAGAVLSSVDLTGTRSLPANSSSAGRFVCAGIPLEFDGTYLRELAPLASPEFTAVSSYDADGNFLADGFLYEVNDATEHYAIKAVYTFSDSVGRAHRSAPSFTGFVKREAGGGPDPVAHFTVSVATPLSFITPFGNYAVEIYMEQAGAFRLIASTSVRPTTEGNIDVSCQVKRVKTGADIEYSLSGKLLYTESSEVTAEVAPPFSQLCNAAGRLFGTYLNRVYYSKKVSTDVGPEFNPLFSKDLVGISDLVGSAGMDDKVVFFEKDKIHVLYGEGPSNTGSGSDFGLLTLPSSVGCTDPASVTGVPDGVFFRSRKGFFILGRDLQLKYVGGGVVNVSKGASVVSVTDVPAHNELRILLKASTTESVIDSDGPTPDSTRPATPNYGNGWVAGTALVFNYESNKWSVFSNHTASAACVLDGRYAMLKSDWDIWQESDAYADPTGDNHLKLITPWIKLRSIQDYGQLWKATLLGRYLSTFVEDANEDLDAGDVQVKVAYDYANTDVDTKLWRASNELQPVERDSAVVSPGAMRLQVRPERQKCSSVRFTIEEKNTADADGLTYRPGQGFEITSIDLELGMRPGTNTALPAKSKK